MQLYAEFLGDQNIARRKIFGSTQEDIRQQATQQGINPVNLQNWSTFSNNVWSPYNQTQPTQPAQPTQPLPQTQTQPTSTPSGASTLKAYDQSGNVVYVERGKYYPGISLTPTVKQQENISPEPSTSDLSTGVQPQLPPESTALSTYMNSLTQQLKDSQAALDQERNRQLAQIQTDKAAAKAEYDTLRAEQAQQMTEYGATTIKEKEAKLAEYAEYEKRWTENYNTVQGLTDELRTMLTNGNELIKQQKAVTGLGSIREPRINQTIADITAQSGVIQAAISSYNGQMNQATTHINTAINAITSAYSDEIDYYKAVYNMYESRSSDTNQRLLNLTSDERKYLESKINSLENDKALVQQNAQDLIKAMTDPDTALLYAKAGVSINDTVEQRSQKIANQVAIQDRTKIKNDMVKSGYQYIATQQQLIGKTEDQLFTMTDSQGNEMIFYKVETEGKKLLSPTEAASLGVPYGTTKAQAEIMGIIPKTELTGEQKINLEVKLAGNFETYAKESRQAQKQINIMKTGYNAAISAGFKGESNNAPSQAVLVTFQKMLDPTSVVRESEYARSGNGQSIMENIKGTIDKLLRGGAGVTQKELKSFYDLSQELLKGYQNEQLNFAQRIQTQAKNYGLNIENILTPDVLDILKTSPSLKNIGQKYNTLDDFIRINPNELSNIENIIKENPNLSDEDILQIYSPDFNQPLSMGEKGSVSFRMNNPLNIKYGEFAKGYGASPGQSALDGGKFAMFPDVNTGIKAAKDLLTGSSYKNLSLEQAMRRWSGGGYGADVAPELKGKTISQMSDSELNNLINKMKTREGWVIV